MKTMNNKTESDIAALNRQVSVILAKLKRMEIRQEITASLATDELLLKELEIILEIVSHASYNERTRDIAAECAKYMAYEVETSQ